MATLPGESRSDMPLEFKFGGEKRRTNWGLALGKKRKRRMTMGMDWRRMRAVILAERARERRGWGGEWMEEWN